jgi:hypothetical protein
MLADAYFRVSATLQKQLALRFHLEWTPRTPPLLAGNSSILPRARACVKRSEGDRCHDADAEVEVTEVKNTNRDTRCARAQMCCKAR